MGYDGLGTIEALLPPPTHSTSHRPGQGHSRRVRDGGLAMFPRLDTIWVGAALTLPAVVLVLYIYGMELFKYKLNLVEWMLVRDGCVTLGFADQGKLPLEM